MVVSAQVARLCEQLRRNTTFLWVFVSHTLTIEEIRELTDAFKVNTQLKDIKMRCVFFRRQQQPLDDDDDDDDNNDNVTRSSAICNLLESILSRPALKNAYLNKNNFTNDHAEAMARTIGTRNSSLENIMLEQNKIGDRGAEAFAESLRNNTKLLSLDLSENNVGTEGCRAIASALCDNETSALQQLYLSRNNVGDDGAKALSEVIRKNKSSLKAMWLFSCNIGYEGSQALSRALPYNSVLGKLYMFGNNSTVDGVLAFEDAMHVNFTMTVLNCCCWDGDHEPAVGLESMERVEELCNENRRIISSLQRLKEEGGPMPLNLWPRALGCFSHKPDLLFVALKTKPGDMFAPRRPQRKRKKPIWLRF